MEKEQAEQLASEMEQQFPHVATSVVQSADMRDAPHNSFIAAHRKDEPGGIELHLHTGLEWIVATEALHVLRP
jgi:adenosyl cobinamide kinase/adenosyl cobinamide phosphate guanylyltransferase